MSHGDKHHHDPVEVPYETGQHGEHQLALDAESRRKTMREVLGFAHRTRGEKTGGRVGLVILVDALGLDEELDEIVDDDVERQRVIEETRLNLELE